MFQPIKSKTILFILALCLQLIACLGTDPPVAEEIVVTTKPTISSEPGTPGEAIQSSGTPVTNIDQIVAMWIASANLEILLKLELYYWHATT